MFSVKTSRFSCERKRAGPQFLVDPQVRLPHLKYVEVEPVFPSEGLPEPVKVACMIRAKNEARWIGRTIQSVKELCGDLIFVMEDGSTDDTVAVCEAAGAVVWPSPFAGRGWTNRGIRTGFCKKSSRNARPIGF